MGAALLLCAACAPRIAGAQDMPGDTLIMAPTFGDPGLQPRVADSSSVRTFGAGASRTPRQPAVPVPTLDQPRWVMLRSALIPGWGQAHNGAWLKAGVIAGVETGLLLAVISDQRELHSLEQASEAAEAAGDTDTSDSLIVAYNARLDGANRRTWWLGAVILYSVVDAYVDAHFKRFKVEFEVDPALPGGKPPSTRLSLRWTY